MSEAVETWLESIRDEPMPEVRALCSKMANETRLGCVALKITHARRNGRYLLFLFACPTGVAYSAPGLAWAGKPGREGDDFASFAFYNILASRSSRPADSSSVRPAMR